MILSLLDLVPGEPPRRPSGDRDQLTACAFLHKRRGQLGRGRCATGALAGANAEPIDRFDHVPDRARSKSPLWCRMVEAPSVWQMGSLLARKRLCRLTLGQYVRGGNPSGVVRWWASRYASASFEIGRRPTLAPLLEQ
jgi:hypothetical protein